MILRLALAHTTLAASNALPVLHVSCFIEKCSKSKIIVFIPTCLPVQSVASLPRRPYKKI
jgi:hypothetical protein